MNKYKSMNKIVEMIGLILKLSKFMEQFPVSKFIMVKVNNFVKINIQVY